MMARNSILLLHNNVPSQAEQLVSGLKKKRIVHAFVSPIIEEV